MTLGQGVGVVFMTAILMVPCSIFIWYPLACAMHRLERINQYAPMIVGGFIAISVAMYGAWGAVFYPGVASFDCHEQYDRQGKYLECD